MADVTKDIDLDAVKSMEELLGMLIELEENGMTDELKAIRSKALFPTTHTTKIDVFGIVRELRPLPIKYSRQVNAAMHVVEKKIKDAFDAKEAVVIDDQMLEALKQTAGILCKFYGDDWKDIEADLTAEEKLSTDDLQSICNTQQRVQGTNDFLLGGLRLVIKMMQLNETLAVKQGMGRQISSSTPQS